jgi:hypothetical protein
MTLRGCSVAQKTDAVTVKLSMVQGSSSRVQRSSEGCRVAGLVITGKHPIGTTWLLAERTRDEENQEIPDVICKCRNAGKKASPASAFLRLVNCVNPASAFRHQGQSGTAGLWLVRHFPAMYMRKPLLIYDIAPDPLKIPSFFNKESFPIC